MTVPARQNLTGGGQWVKPTRKLSGADVALALRTTTGTSPVFNLEDARQIDAEVNVTAVAGAGTVQLKLQVSQDGTTFFDSWPNALPAVAAVSVQRATFAALGTIARWAWTITGTSVTFGVDHQAVTA